MRRVATLLLLIIAVLGTASAGKDKRVEAEGLFARANRLMDFDHGMGIAPYTMHGHFRLMFDQPVEGTVFRAVLRDREVTRSEINFPGYSEVVVRNEDRKWVRRSADVTPVRVTLLLGLLGPLRIHEIETVERLKEQMVGSTRSKCVELRGKLWSREVCFDSATGLPLREKKSLPVQEETYYETYSNADGQQFPTKLHVTQGDKVVADLWVDSMSWDLPDKSLFEPLQDAMVWPVCNDMKRPVPISTPDPSYTETEKNKRVQGTVRLQVVIDEQGRTHNIVVVQSLTPGLDKEARAAVSNWRFQPAKCGDKPVPVEMNIEVNFKL